MRRTGNVEENLRKHAHGSASSDTGEFFGKLVRLRNVSGDAHPLAHQVFAKRKPPGATPAHIDVSIKRLHAKQNDALPGPTPRCQQSQRVQRAPTKRLEQAYEPRSDASWPGASVSQDSGKKAHRIRAFRITD